MEEKQGYTVIKTRFSTHILSRLCRACLQVKVSQLRNKVAAVVKMTPQDLDRLSVDMVVREGEE